MWPIIWWVAVNLSLNPKTGVFPTTCIYILTYPVSASPKRKPFSWILYVLLSWFWFYLQDFPLELPIGCYTYFLPLMLPPHMSVFSSHPLLPLLLSLPVIFVSPLYLFFIFSIIWNLFHSWAHRFSNLDNFFLGPLFSLHFFACFSWNFWILFLFAYICFFYHIRKTSLTFNYTIYFI